MRRLAGALIITLAIGVASRVWPIGFVVWDKVVGDALYAVALYLVIALVATALHRTWSAQVIGGVTVGVCWAIEAFQATGWTARTVASANLRHVLGTTFGFTDLIWYLLGVVVIALVDIRWLRPGIAGPSPDPTPASDPASSTDR